MALHFGVVIVVGRRDPGPTPFAFCRANAHRSDATVGARAGRSRLKFVDADAASLMGPRLDGSTRETSNGRDRTGYVRISSIRTPN
jgi:hypothetical protein